MLYIFYCFMLCVTDPSWSLDLLDWDHCFYITTWHYFRPVSMCYHLSYVYHLATVLSSNHLPCHYLARPFLLCHDLPDYYQSFDMLITCLISSSYHAITWHPAWWLDLWLSSLRGPWLMILCHDQWPVYCIPALHAVTWLYSTYVLQISWSCPDSIIPVKW